MRVCMCVYVCVCLYKVYVIIYLLGYTLCIYNYPDISICK